jgi:kinesin family protein 5
VDVYTFAVQPCVADLIEGYNSTVLAYGQTGSGKTFSMMGPEACMDPNLFGIIPRVMKEIFRAIENADEHSEFTVKVSYVEIYLDRVRGKNFLF